MQREGTEVFSQSTHLRRLTLEEGTVRDVAGEDVEESEGDENRDSCTEESSHEEDKVGIGSFLGDVQLELSNLAVHLFLEDLSLLALQFFGVGAAAFIEEEGAPEA